MSPPSATTQVPVGQVSSPDGPTGKLCTWVDSLTLEDVPEDIKERTKYLILDGIACALVGAHLPWSEKAAAAIFDMESPGACTIYGYEQVRFVNALQINQL